MENECFYKKGLRFSCTRCSACCRYSDGYVYLSENDVCKLAAFLKMDKDSFIGVYCRWVDGRSEKSVLSLKDKANKDCIFWDNAGCKVYEKRPLQCQLFPFWDNIVVSSHAWESAATGCPGMNKGQLYTKEEIEVFLKTRLNEPILKRGGE